MALSFLLPLVGLYGPLQELNVFEPCVERELLEVVPEVGGYLEVEIDQCLVTVCPRWRAPEDSVIGVFSFVARMVLASMADGFLDMGFYSLVSFSEFANIRYEFICLRNRSQSPITSLAAGPDGAISRAVRPSVIAVA